MTPSRVFSGERFTAAISTFVVLVIVAGVLTAQPPREAPSDKLARLEADLQFQLDLSYRLDRTLHDERVEQFEEARALWNQSPKSSEDATRYAQWLNEAIENSLPERRAALPPSPEFGAPEPVADVVKSTLPAPSPDPIVESTINPALAPGIERQRRDAEVSTSRTGNAPDRRLPPETETPIVVAAAVPSEPITATPRTPTPTTSPAPQSMVSSSRTERVVAKPVIDPPATGEVQHSPETDAPSTIEFSPPAARVAVNLDELNARITGYHEGLAEVMATAVTKRQSLSLEQIAALCDRLEELASQQQFINLYYDSLTDAERRSVVAPRPCDSAARLLRSELDEARAEDADDFLQPFEAGNGRAAALEARLEKLCGTAGQ